MKRKPKLRCHRMIGIWAKKTLIQAENYINFVRIFQKNIEFISDLC